MDLRKVALVGGMLVACAGGNGVNAPVPSQPTNIATPQASAIASAPEAPRSAARSKVPPATAYFNRLAVTDTRSCYVSPSGKLACWGDTQRRDEGVKYLEAAANGDTLCLVREGGSIDCVEGAKERYVSGEGQQITVRSDGKVCSIAMNGGFGCGAPNPSIQLIDLVGAFGLTPDHDVVGQDHKLLPLPQKVVTFTQSGCFLFFDGSLKCQYPPDRWSAVPKRAQWLFAGREESTCAVLDAGRIECFGGPITFSGPRQRLIAASFSKLHACGITEAEKVICWGLATAAAYPPEDIGSYLGSLSYPVGPGLFGNADGPASLTNNRLAPAATCKRISLDAVDEKRRAQLLDFFRRQNTNALAFHDAVNIASPAQLVAAFARREPVVYACGDSVETSISFVPKSWNGPSNMLPSSRFDLRLRLGNGPLAFRDFEASHASLRQLDAVLADGYSPARSNEAASAAVTTAWHAKAIAYFEPSKAGSNGLDNQSRSGFTIAAGKETLFDFQMIPGDGLQDLFRYDSFATLMY